MNSRSHGETRANKKNKKFRKTKKQGPVSQRTSEFTSEMITLNTEVETAPVGIDVNALDGPISSNR